MIPFKLPFSSKSLLAMFLPPEVWIGGKEDIAAPSSRPKEYSIKRYAIPNENNITTVLPVLPWLKIIIQNNIDEQQSTRFGIKFIYLLKESSMIYST